MNPSLEPSTEPPVAGRPLPLTAVCAVGWFVAGLQVLSGLTQGAQSYARDHGAPGWLPPVLAAAGVLSALSLLGVWRMRRGGVLGFILATALTNGVMLYAHLWGAQFIVFPVVATAAGLGFLPRMR